MRPPRTNGTLPSKAELKKRMDQLRSLADAGDVQAIKSIVEIRMQRESLKRMEGQACAK